MTIAHYISIIGLITGVILTIVGFLVKWILNQFDRKIDLIFLKIDEMVKKSDLESLRNQVNQEINKKEIALAEIDRRIRDVEKTQDRCQSCQS